MDQSLFYSPNIQAIKVTKSLRIINEMYTNQSHFNNGISFRCQIILVHRIRSGRDSDRKLKPTKCLERQKLIAGTSKKTRHRLASTARWGVFWCYLGTFSLTAPPIVSLWFPHIHTAGGKEESWGVKKGNAPSILRMLSENFCLHMSVKQSHDCIKLQRRLGNYPFIPNSYTLGEN